MYKSDSEIYGISYDERVGVETYFEEIDRRKKLTPMYNIELAFEMMENDQYELERELYYENFIDYELSESEKRMEQEQMQKTNWTPVDDIYEEKEVLPHWKECCDRISLLLEK